EEYNRLVKDLSPKTIKDTLQRHLDLGNLTVAILVPDDIGVAGKIEEWKKNAKKTILRAAKEELQAIKARYATAALVAESESAVLRHTLPNGVRILVKRDSSVPMVAFRAVWVGGVRAETEKTNGVNNMLAALATRGTSARSAEEIVREIEGMAGSIGGFSGRNSFGIRAEMLSRSWEKGLEILADCILHPTLPDDELEKERHQVLEEIRAQEDNLTSVAFRLFAQSLYRKHPYRFDLQGTPLSVSGLTRRMLRDYYQRYFPIGRMTLAVVGDVEPGRVVERVAAAFGAEQTAATEPRVTQRENLRADRDGPLEVYRFMPRQQAHMVVGFPGTTIDDPDRYALEVLATILSGQGGRLFVELRDRQGLAYRINAFSLEGIDPGYFAVYIACSPENLQASLDGIRNELRRISGEPVALAELERAKRYLVGTHEISLQRRAALAATLAFHESYGLGYDGYLKYSTEILAVDQAAVERVAREYLVWEKAVIATVKPEEVSPGVAARIEKAKKQEAKATAKKPGKRAAGATKQSDHARPKATKPVGGRARRTRR
ncbi:MAG: pitrilysin family protein, partial [Pseudomonadota bacterium]